MATKTTKKTEQPKPETGRATKYNWEEADVKTLRNRLNRVVGQIKGIINMIDDSRGCEEVLIQLASSYKSIRCVSNMVLCNNLVTCVKTGVMQGKYEMLDEAMEIFKRYQ